MSVHHPLCCARTDLLAEQKRWTLQSEEGEVSDKVCESADAPASFSSEAWRHFGFLLPRSEEGGKVTDREKTVL